MTNRKYIATRLHRALEMAGDDTDLVAMTQAPHYVVDRRLTEMLAREDVSRSITAVIEAQLAHMPFPSLLVEFDAEDSVRRFAHIFERPDENAFDVVLAVLNGPALTVTRAPIRIEIVNLPVPGFVVRPSQSSELDRLAAVFAVAVGMLMLNINGVEKDVVEPRKLNRSREAVGKPSIPRHTVLRIGTVIDSAGRSVRYADGRHMPIHLRAGHVRHQVCGKGRTERKLIYIPPVLVNFHPGDERQPPKPQRLLTK